MWLALHSSVQATSLDYDYLFSRYGVLRIDTRLATRDLTFLHSVFAGRINSMDVLSMLVLPYPLEPLAADIFYIVQPPS